MIGFVNSHGSLLKPLDYFGRCFFVIMLKTKGKNKLTEALVKTGSYKHAVLSDGLCYLSYKDMAYYVESKRKYYSNIDKFNYPCVKPIAYVDECCCVIQPIASGRQLTKEDVYHLLKSLLSYFRNQKFISKDANDILYYVQHGDALPGNSWIDLEGQIFFIDLDELENRPALFDFFNVICRICGFELLLRARNLFREELQSAFRKHGVKYDDAVYDLYLSKFVSIRFSEIDRGYNNGKLYKSMEWVYDQIVEQEFPITNSLVKQYCQCGSK